MNSVIENRSSKNPWHELALRKAKGESKLYQQWLMIIDHTRTSLRWDLLSDEDLEVVVLASQTPDQLITLNRLSILYERSRCSSFTPTYIAKLQGTIRTFIQSLFFCAQESPYSLQDWIQAIDFFYQWLIQNQKKVHPSSMLEYLSCCVASTDQYHYRQRLIELLKSMLNEYGYERG